MNLASKKTIANPHFEECGGIALSPGFAWEEIRYMRGILACSCTHLRCRSKAVSPKHHRFIACHSIHGTGSASPFYAVVFRLYGSSWKLKVLAAELMVLSLLLAMQEARFDP